MSQDFLETTVELLAIRRRQFAAIADAVDAAVALLDVVETTAVTRSFADVDEFLACAPDEHTRALWSSWLDRATQPLPDMEETTDA